MEFNPDSKIKFYNDLTISFLPDEKKRVAMLRWSTDKALRVEQEVIQIFTILTYGKTIQETADLVKRPNIEIINLLKKFYKVGFIKEIDGNPVKDSIKKIKPWFKNFSGKSLAFLTKKTFIVPVVLFIVISIGLAVTMPQYYPNYKQFFWTENLLIVLVSAFLIESVLILTHEFAHFVTTKAIGGEGTMSLSYRAVYIVAETKSYHLSVLPKRKRYIVYMAGIMVDAFIASTAYWILFLNSRGFIYVPSIINNLLLVVILLEIKGIAWQLNVALKTDMYNVVSDHLGHRHLKENTINYIKFKLGSFGKKLLNIIKPNNEKTIELQFFRAEELKQIRFYTAVLLVGLMFIYIQFVFFVIPRDILLITKALKELYKAVELKAAGEIIKSIILILLVTIQYILLIWLTVKDKNNLVIRKEDE